MALALDGDSLGKRHQSYNNLLKNALQYSQLIEPADNSKIIDIYNLLKIDIASKNQNVEYLLEVMNSEDELYVSKAIKRSSWIINDEKYAHIINPEHLYKQMKPHMMSKAFNKLMLNVRLHLKDEKRVESFYNFVKEQDTKLAFKWLQHCSITFIEKEVEKHYENMPKYIIKRLFEKSFKIFEIYTRKSYWGNGYRLTKDAEFLAVKYPEKFLDLIESFEHWPFVNFGPKSTKTFMELCPQRILDKFEKYGKTVDLNTFVLCLKKKENIKDFLLKQAKNTKVKYLFEYSKIKHFIKHIPKEERFEFVKMAFIDKNKEVFECADDDAEDCELMCDDVAMKCSMPVISQNTNIYQWYKFAPFDVAFKDLKKLVRAESVPANRNLILQTLLYCAGRNMHNIHTVLQYYFDKHINEPFKFKIQFVNIFVSHVDIHTLSDETWDLLDQLFHSMEVYTESKNNVQSCIQAIIIRKTIRNEEIPEIVKIKFEFNTLKAIQKKLKTEEEKEVIFKYLYAFLTTKLDNLNISTESEFRESFILTQNLLNLMKVWDKDLLNQSYVLDKIKNLVKLKREKKWDVDLSSLYRVKDAWRKVLFEESISLLLTENVLINALKHDASLLARNKDEIIAKSCKDDILLRQLLRKIRIYWSESLYEEWSSAYMQRLDQPGGHKALIIALCILLPQKQINELLNKYAPIESKTDWKSNQLEFSITRQLANNVHIARPLASIDEILKYAKGDYLQYTVPTLNSILSQLSSNKCRHCIPKLLDAPVSLQKFGVRCAFHKLNSQELKPMFSEVWNSTKNSSIRTVLFTHTFALLCKEKNTSNIYSTWDLLSMFIDNLTPDENKIIYNKLGLCTEVPMCVRPQCFMKSYSFLKSLPPKTNCESILRQMEYNIKEIIPHLDENFIINEFFNDFENTFIKNHNIYDKAQILSLFILSSKDDDTEIRRYEKVLAPILDKYLPELDKKIDDDYRIVRHVQQILQNLLNLRIFIQNEKVPKKCLTIIHSKLESSLSYLKDYHLLTIWKLVVVFANILDENKSIFTSKKETEEKDGTKSDENDKLFAEIHKEIAPKFVKICVEYLRADLKKFGPTIYSLFSLALNEFFDSYLSTYSSGCSTATQIEYMKGILLESGNEREIYMMVHHAISRIINCLYADEDKKKIEGIRDIVFTIDSDEVKMHFYQLLGRYI